MLQIFSALIETLREWLFGENEVYSFLTFCFGLNTMFSFASVRMKLLEQMKSGVNKSFEQVKGLEKDCRERVKWFPLECQSEIDDCVKISTLAEEIEKSIADSDRRLEWWAKIFDWFFRLAAISTAFFLIFPKHPVLINHCHRTIILLVPSLLFAIIYFLYYCRFRMYVHKFNDKIEKSIIKLSTAKKIMDKILTGK